VPGFFVPVIHSFDVRFAPKSSHSVDMLSKVRYRPKADIPGRLKKPSYFNNQVFSGG